MLFTQIFSDSEAGFGNIKNSAPISIPSSVVPKAVVPANCSVAEDIDEVELPDSVTSSSFKADSSILLPPGFKEGITLIMSSWPFSCLVRAALTAAKHCIHWLQRRFPNRIFDN